MILTADSINLVYDPLSRARSDLYEANEATAKASDAYGDRRGGKPVLITAEG